MKTLQKTLLVICLLGIALVGIGVVYFQYPKTSIPIGVASQSSPTKPTQGEANLFPFAIDMVKAEHDPYFGTPVPYDPNDPTMNLMRQIMLGLAKAMDNPKHPCNPLVTTNSRIIGMNIKPLHNGDKRYTMWVSDGKTTCGMDLIHFEGAGGYTFKGDFFQEFYLREMAGGFGYNSKAEAEAVIKPDKKRFWKQDVGEAAHDMVVDALGQDFLNNTLPQEYSGFFVSDAYNAGYIQDGHSYNFFTHNIVDAILKRTDMPQVSPYDMFYTEKFHVHFQAEPTNSPLAFKVVHISANYNGFDPSKMNGGSGQKNAVRFR